MTEVVVVGGGLAGLVAARRLAEAGASVTLFEGADDVGGRVGTRRRDGYVLDRGFQVLFDAYPAVRRELDLAALDCRRFESGATIARRGRRSVLRDPRRHPGGVLASLSAPEVGLGDALRLGRLAAELGDRSWEAVLVRGGTSIETALRERGFSRSFREEFAAPFYGGITLDRSLSTDAAVFEYATKALLHGRAVLPADGMGAVPAQLAERATAAGASVETGRRVTSLEVDRPDDGGRRRGASRVALDVGGRTRIADAVVVATGPHDAAALTGLESIPTDGRGCVTQYVSLPSGDGPGLDPRLVLDATGDGPNTLAPLSAVAPSYAPDDRELYAATYLADQIEADSIDAADEAALFERTREALSAWYPEASFSALEPVATDRVPFSQFVQQPGFRAALPRVDEPAGPVYLAGDYTRWSSIQGALESGRLAAAAVREHELA